MSASLPSLPYAASLCLRKWWASAAAPSTAPHCWLRPRARVVLGSAFDLGLIFAALAAGSLLGNAVYTLMGPRIPRRVIFIGGFAVRACAFWVLVTMPAWWMIAAVIFVAAVLFEPINPLEMTITQERVPPGLRARVFGAMSALSAGTLALGILAYGWLIDDIGLAPTLLLLAIVNSALPLAMFAIPGLRAMPRPAPSHTTPSSNLMRGHRPAIEQ